MPKKKDDVRAEVKKVAKLIDSKKGTGVIVLDMRKISTITDYFIIATGNSVTHLQALARYIIETTDEKPINPMREFDNNWVLLDYGPFIVHLFLAETRSYYGLEDLWADAPRLKKL